MNASETSFRYSSFEDSKRSSPSLLARQLRLRLQADDNSDIPRNLHNIVVSIHAIATFQALHDYLRPRVAGLIGGSSRLSSMLSAIAGLGGPFSGNSDNPPPPKLSDSAPVGTSLSQNIANDGPRRSRRLSAKIAGGSGGGGNDEGPSNESNAKENSAQGGEPTPEPQGETLYADFTDDEVDADVFDEEVELDQSGGDKTVSLSVAEGMPCSL